MGFDSGFQKVAMDKEAFLGALAGGLARAGMAVARPLAGAAAGAARTVAPAARMIGQGMSRAGGAGLRGAARVVGGSSGPMGFLGLGLTGMQGISDYNKYKAQMNAAIQR